jgi:hypothetical protein
MTNSALPPLSSHEASELQNAIAKVLPASGGAVSFSDLLMRWQALVTEVERGYQLTAYDYTNDLSARDRLEEVGALLSPELRAKVMSTVAPLDQRFLSATEETGRPLSNRTQFWWRRIPRKRDPEFDETM